MNIFFLLSTIFLRLDAAADLARASAACTSFCRIISARCFLRRFRSLRSPAVLGLISSSRYQPFFPVEPPHRSAPEARALEQAVDFTFSFLPDPSMWHFRHARDGRVLLCRLISTKIQFEDFVVCDPLHRRYVKIPRIPDDLLAFAADNGTTRPVLPVLAPAGENDEEESFRVIWTVQHQGKGRVVVFIFSSCNQTWRAIISTISLPNGCLEYKSYYAHGCLYLMFSRMAYSLMLDTSEMKFSIIDLPPHNLDSMHAIVRAQEGRLGFLTIADGTIDLYCKNWQSNGVGAQEWQHDKLIPLPKDSGINYTWTILGTEGRYLALRGSHEICHEFLKSEYFVLDTKTLLLEMVCTSSNVVFLGIPYARFPPLFTLPSI
jgi:hypothetical protein